MPRSKREAGVVGVGVGVGVWVVIGIGGLVGIIGVILGGKSVSFVPMLNCRD